MLLTHLFAIDSSFHTATIALFFDFDVSSPSQTGGTNTHNTHAAAEALLIFFGHSSLSAAALISSRSN